MQAKDAGTAARITEIIERQRRAENISQIALAERLGISQSTYQRSVRGERSFRLEELLKVARLLEMKPEVLFAGAA
jgi:transcriptional regulator with XRE-family HTH domain